MFTTQFELMNLSLPDDISRPKSCPGSRERILYEGYYTDEGRLELRECGRENLYDFIQSYKDSTDINVLLRRYRDGETDVLERVQGTFGDFTVVPNNYAEMLNRVIAGETAFYDLPVEVRAKFDHNFAVFMQEIGSDSFYEKLGISKPETSAEPSESDTARVEDRVEESAING